MASVTYKVLVSGVVQGVGFRASMRDMALSYGVKGWVRNRGDGSVEALVQGEAAQVAGLLEWARVGPPGARVTSVEKHALEGFPPQTRFSVLVEDWQTGPANR
ncbi:MAG: acylphosphatase [Thaumarchaeota archaeon]|nr:acylphosphatase [Nitrososphaerota archaeon]